MDLNPWVYRNPADDARVESQVDTIFLDCLKMFLPSVLWAYKLKFDLEFSIIELEYTIRLRLYTTSNL